MTFLKALQKRAEARGVSITDVIQYLEGDIKTEVPDSMQRFYEIDVGAEGHEQYSLVCNLIISTVQDFGNNKYADEMKRSFIQAFVYDAFCDIEYTRLKCISDMSIKEEFKYLEDLTNDLFDLRYYRSEYNYSSNTKKDQETPLIIKPEEQKIKEIDRIIESINL